MIAAIRDWASRHSAEKRYTPVGITFHWVMAALIVFLLGWGWYMGQLPPGADKTNAYDVHSDVGLLVLVLGGLRGLWRLIVPGPVNDADALGWQTILAKLTHILFYICFFGLPLSGLAMRSAIADGSQLSLAGVIPWPTLPFETLSVGLQWRILDVAESLHHVLIILLAVLVPMHVVAALKHHFIDRHDVLEGMLPQLPEDDDPEAPRHGLQARGSPRPSGGG